MKKQLCQSNGLSMQTGFTMSHFLFIHIGLIISQQPEATTAIWNLTIPPVLSRSIFDKGQRCQQCRFKYK